MCSKGPKIVIDCEFEDLMQDNEKKSMAQQISYVYNSNKSAGTPCDIHVTGLKDKEVMQVQL